MTRGDQKQALMEHLSRRDDLTPHEKALEVAAVTLALEAGARIGLDAEKLDELLRAAAEQGRGVGWVEEHMALAREALAQPEDAEGVWKESLLILQPLGMDLD